MPHPGIINVSYCLGKCLGWVKFLVMCLPNIFSSIFQPSCSYKRTCICWQWRTHLFAEEINKKHKDVLFGYFKFLWLLRSAQFSPENCLTIWSFSPSCLLTSCLLKKKKSVMAPHLGYHQNTLTNLLIVKTCKYCTDCVVSKILNKLYT